MTASQQSARFTEQSYRGNGSVDESSAKKITITPELAAAWLAKNTHNRTIRKSWVKELARRITSGLWRTTHQGIAFDSQGTLIDGQHRLLAVLEANAPVVMWVFFAGDMSHQLVVDDHGKRSPFDALSLSEIDIAKELTRDHVSTARGMMIGINCNYRWANQELRDFVEAYFPAIDFATSHVLARGKRAHLTIATVAAVIGRAYFHEDKARLIEFCEMLYTGKIAEDTDTAVLRLRDWLLGSNTNGGGGSAKKDIYLRVERALSAFCKHQPLAKLYQANCELYPLPTEISEESSTT